MQGLEPYDARTAERIKAMQADGVACQLDARRRDRQGERQGLRAHPRDDRVAGQQGEIIVTSRRYDDVPMVLSSPGAGLKVTAAGIFADLLHLSRSLVEFSIKV